MDKYAEFLHRLAKGIHGSEELKQLITRAAERMDRLEEVEGAAREFVDNPLSESAMHRLKTMVRALDQPPGSVTVYCSMPKIRLLAKPPGG